MVYRIIACVEQPVETRHVLSFELAGLPRDCFESKLMKFRRVLPLYTRSETMPVLSDDH
jgi:hypothetical protein